jgi:hypothetical protein
MSTKMERGSSGSMSTPASGLQVSQQAKQVSVTADQLVPMEDENRGRQDARGATGVAHDAVLDEKADCADHADALAVVCAN